MMRRLLLDPRAAAYIGSPLRYILDAQEFDCCVRDHYQV